MATAIKSGTSRQPANTNGSLYLFTVEQYQEMEKTGVFGSDRVELIEGQVVKKGPMNPPHIQAVSRLRRQIEMRLSQGHFVRIQSDITLSNSQPQPDGAVVVGANDDDYGTHHPVPADIELVVEVADTTLAADRTDKLRMYARDRIRVYWIVNIPERQVEVYTRPVAGNNPRYRQTQTFTETDTVSVTIGGVVVGPIAVADLLPPA